MDTHSSNSNTNNHSGGYNSGGRRNGNLPNAGGNGGGLHNLVSPPLRRQQQQQQQNNNADPNGAAKADEGDNRRAAAAAARERSMQQQAVASAAAAARFFDTGDDSGDDEEVQHPPQFCCSISRVPPSDPIYLGECRNTIFDSINLHNYLENFQHNTEYVSHPVTRERILREELEDNIHPVTGPRLRLIQAERRRFENNSQRRYVPSPNAFHTLFTLLLVANIFLPCLYTQKR